MRAGTSPRLRGGSRGSFPLLRLAALTAALVLAGCGAAPAAEPELPVASAPAISPGELERAKKAAGIEDCPTSDRAVAAVTAGLPDVVLSCLGGGRAVRLAGLRGQPMMINIWAQWCQPCQEEAPFIAEVANEKDSDLMILGIDYEDPRPDRAIEFARVLAWRFPQLVDQDKVLAGPLQIVGPPQTFFVRADGTIAGRHVGAFRSAEQIRAQAREYLGVDL
jgi:cytochrome c biogenesis protein CcmG/thiol:disulfide interchange protein DsbE